MNVFDSNIWIYGLTRTCDHATELVDEALNTTGHVGISAYIFEEVMQNLKRSKYPHEEVERVQERFSVIICQEDNIQGPTQKEIERVDVEAQRRDQRVQAMADAFDIQAKDVPIAVYAHGLSRKPDCSAVRIHTADREFAGFNTHSHFGNILMQYVDCSD